jgi:chromosome segregation ATPase
VVEAAEVPAMARAAYQAAGLPWPGDEVERLRERVRELEVELDDVAETLECSRAHVPKEVRKMRQELRERVDDLNAARADLKRLQGGFFNIEINTLMEENNKFREHIEKLSAELTDTKEGRREARLRRALVESRLNEAAEMLECEPEQVPEQVRRLTDECKRAIESERAVRSVISQSGLHPATVEPMDPCTIDMLAKIKAHCDSPDNNNEGVMNAAINTWWDSGCPDLPREGGG